MSRSLRILFVSTRKNSSPEDRELYEMEFMNELLGFDRSLLDLGLLTVAAATPSDVEVRVVDEHLEAIPYDADVDLVALSAKTSCVTHAYEVAREFRRRGTPVVLGGIHASLRPEEALEHVDHVVVGEAEESWPRFVELYRERRAPRLMEAAPMPPMDRIPVPAWGRIDPGRFLFHQIQTTRGCPFSCRFCSVPDISGKEFRFKPVERVMEEIRALPRSGFLKDRMKALYFVDDNFISRTRYTKELLESLAEHKAKVGLPEWSAETTLNVARDEELLDLFAAAGCGTLIVGFESVSEATLVSMDKKVNFCITYQEALDRIHRRGISVVGNFIVGFDTDTSSVFHDTLRFVEENHILYPFYSILTPMPGTKLHDEMRDAGRLDHMDWARYDTRHVVFEPANMSREELMDGYAWLYEQSYASSRALDRLESFWRTYGKRRSGIVENAIVRRMARRFEGRGTPRFRQLLADGWRRLALRGVRTDVGQLLYFLDAGMFTDYLDRYRSSGYEANARAFAGGAAAGQAARAQWDRARERASLAAVG